MWVLYSLCYVNSQHGVYGAGGVLNSSYTSPGTCLIHLMAFVVTVHRLKLDPYYNCNKTCNMQLATHCSCKKRYYICNKTCNKRCKKLHNVADLISIILCAHNFIREVASCSQSQRNLRSAHCCWVLTHTCMAVSQSARTAFEFL